MYTFTKHWFNDQRPLHDRYLPRNAEVHILEIGAFEGMSTVYFAEALTHPNSTLDTIDPFLVTDTTTPVEHTTFELFCGNILNAPNKEKITIHKTTSREALPYLQKHERMYDYILVDGSHEPEEVEFDAENVLPLLKPGGILFFDDYGSPALTALLNAFCERHPEFTVVHRAYHLVLQRTFSSTNK
jgi:predicted O-methyltransferase YrrM